MLELCRFNTLTAGMVILFWLLIFIVSCKEISSVSNKKLTYTVVREINISVGQGNYNYSSMDIVEERGEWFIYGFDQENYDLTILNLNQEKVQQHIKYTDEGPNALIAPRSMHVHNTDSIFFLNDLNEVYLFNKSERVDYWKLDASIPRNYFKVGEPGYTEYTLFAINKPELLSMDFNYIRVNRSIVVNLIILPSYNFASDYQKQSKLPVLFEIRLDENKFIDYVPNFNSGDKGIKLNVVYPFVTSAEGIELVGMNYTDKVYNKKLDSVIIISSNNAKGKVTLFEPTQEFDLGQDVKAFNQDEAYLGIYYDKYRQVYYRIFQWANYNLSNSGTVKQKIQAGWSLIVFRPEGEILGEVAFPKETYNFLELFVLPEGVLLYKENPFAENNNEDVLSFDLITINYE